VGLFAYSPPPTVHTIRLVWNVWVYGVGLRGCSRPAPFPFRQLDVGDSTPLLLSSRTRSDLLLMASFSDIKVAVDRVRACRRNSPPPHRAAPRPCRRTALAVPVSWLVAAGCVCVRRLYVMGLHRQAVLY
jgi:hypothetical protein